MSEVNAFSKNNLPKGWEWKRLGDVVTNLDGKRIPLSKHVRAKRKGQYRYYGATEIVDFIDDFIFDGEYLLIGEDGANLVSKSRPLAFIVEGKFWVNNHAHVLQPKDTVSQKYLCYYFNSLNLAPYVSGSAQPKLNQANLNKIPIPIPSKDEQVQIVCKIEELFSELDKSIEQLKTSHNQLEVYRQGVLKSGFEGRYSKNVSGWIMLKLKEASNKIVVGYVGPITEHLTKSEGISFLTTTHIGENELLTHDIRQVTKSFNEKNKKSQVKPGDIIIARHGDSGKACIIPEWLKEAQVSNAVILRPNQALVLSKFICLRLNYERQAMQKMKVGGVHQVVNTKSMENFEIILPPIVEQEAILTEIERRLSVADKLEDTIIGSLQQAEALRQGILKKAFEGKLLPQTNISYNDLPNSQAYEN